MDDFRQVLRLIRDTLGMKGGERCHEYTRLAKADATSSIAAFASTTKDNI